MHTSSPQSFCTYVQMESSLILHILSNWLLCSLVHIQIDSWGGKKTFTCRDWLFSISVEMYKLTPQSFHTHVQMIPHSFCVMYRSTPLPFCLHLHTDSSCGHIVNINNSVIVYTLLCMDWPLSFFCTLCTIDSVISYLCTLSTLQSFCTYVQIHSSVIPYTCTDSLLSQSVIMCRWVSQSFRIHVQIDSSLMYTYINPSSVSP